MTQAKVMQPLVVTDAMIIGSTLYEVAPAAYAAGTTYALGVYVSVAGTLGEMLIYKSLQAGNIGNTPASSPTWWVYTSSTYGVYNPLTTYPLGHRVIDTVTHRIKESQREGNNNKSLDNLPAWKYIGKATYPLNTADWIGSITYTLGALALAYSAAASLGIDHDIAWVCRSKQGGNLGNSPPVDPPSPSIPPTPPPSTVWWDLIGLAYPKFNIFAVYAKGEKVTDTDGSIYECQYNNTSRSPLVNTLTWWLDIAPNNRTAMFDVQTDTKSVASKEISFVLATGLIDTIGMVGLSADMVTVELRDGLGGTLVFSKTVGLTGGNPTEAWSYYFSEPTLRQSQIIIDGIPPYVNSHLTVTLSGTGTISVGNVLIGKNKDIGLAEYGLTSGMLDFSLKTTDAFGVTTFVKRGFKKKVNVRTFVDNTKLNLLQNLLYTLRAEPCLWQFSVNPQLSEATILYGFYKDFSTDISYPTTSYVNIEIEGLI